jgi:hypothetical protein
MKLRYSLRTLLILMLLVGPLCIWGWPAYESWRDERARVVKEAWEIKRVQQRIAILDQQYRIAGGRGGPTLTGKETIDKLMRIELELEMEMQLLEARALMDKITQSQQGSRQEVQVPGILDEVSVYGGDQIRPWTFPLHFEGSAKELREHLGLPEQEPSQP